MSRVAGPQGSLLVVCSVKTVVACVCSYFTLAAWYALMDRRLSPFQSMESMGGGGHAIQRPRESNRFLGSAKVVTHQPTAYRSCIRSAHIRRSRCCVAHRRQL